ncbi:complex I subunit 5 family protein [Clostridium peptidivorans]|uniref:complex I subunit 5 family protein n=1 Tax=Clostridium peptidivorans TaxID=100174 RepID=UPI000BE25345|nr:proton-conducting transporter membrane subunit [Clostridium peptidivorans]
MTIIQSFPLMGILMLFLIAFSIPLLKNNSTVKFLSIISFVTCLILFSISLIHTINNGSYFYRIGHFNAPFGIEFKIGNIECIISVLFAFVALMVTWYSCYSIEHDIDENKVPLYYLLVNILIASLLGIVFSNDMFNAYVFIEIGNLASCGIVIVKDKKENIKAGFKYLIMSCLGSGLVLLGIAYLYSITGQLNITYIHEELAKNYANYPQAIRIILGLFTVGLGVKSAMFPLHTWLPDAHSNAPTSSSAILSSLVLKAYVIFLFKILYRVMGKDIIVNFSILNIILVLGCLGMIMGSIFAIFQKNLKRVIAYSSVAQMGYIFFSIGLGTELGFIMSIFHIIGHAVTKSALFLCAGAIIEKTGQKELPNLKGIGKEMPYTLGLFFIASLSMLGIPMLPGFVSKWYLALGSIEANKLMLIGVILISSLLNAIYYLPIAINGFFGEENLKGKIYRSKDKSIKELMPIVILIIAMLYVGIASEGIINLIKIGLV